MSEFYLRTARGGSADRFKKLQAELEPVEALIADEACVYATGSFGRMEAGPHSDLDLFIVVRSAMETTDEGQNEVRALSGIKEIKLKYYLVDAVEKQDIEDFDGDGKYLKVHTIREFTSNLGSPQDDSKNTFTGRLLMLLEGRPLLGLAVYEDALQQVVEAYFRDFEGNEHQFIPAFLFNDVIRMWRTFCVNYEFYRKKGTAKSKVKLFKLKYVRMLTCYSALAYLLALFGKHGTIGPDDVKAMVALTPTERLEALASPKLCPSEEIREVLSTTSREVLDLYSGFLEVAHRHPDELADEFAQNQQEWRERSHCFAAKFAELLEIMENGSRAHPELYRFVLI